jgi:translocation and assembly module TamB
MITTSRTNLSGPRQTLALRNQGPIVATVSQARVNIEQAHLTGPKTDVVITGNATLQPTVALNLTVNSNVDLALLHEIDNDISSEGGVVLNATIQGPARAPAMRGRLMLDNAAFQMGSLPNGLSKANGTVVFNGDTATIESLTGESGGGTVRISGTLSRYGNVIQYNLDARATRVRVRTQAGVSAVANVNASLTGNSENSLLTGRVTLQSVGFTSRTDFGSVLTQASAPAETPSAPQGFVAGMRLNVSIRLASGAIVQTALAENVEAEADLTLRGTLANPGMLGQVRLNQGQVLFFGNKYQVNEGSVSFFNPNKIEPILNLNLETKARGVGVTLAVTGPIQNMTLAYQSDPPLPFDEIVGLLATGRVPTSDPVLVARQPAAPQQSFQQMGASAVMSTAVTNPVAGQLQRVFGVSQLKIDPTFTSGSELPQARLTLQQQVTSNLTFTYVTNLTRSNPQIIRVEWAIDNNWSAIASRQENGLVALDLFYKRRIH